MTKRVLMIAYHFPPFAGSSGIQRTLRFVQHLPAFGWQPLVLSCQLQAYEHIKDDLLADIPTNTVIRRAFALDTARHLALNGRYFAFMARPDRWVSWTLDGVRQGLRLIREYRPQALWSTYPIATAHLIGARLQRSSHLPWIADFRDPMAQDGYPADPLTWSRFRQIEQRTIAQAHTTFFVTPGAAHIYRERYPHAAARIAVLENGFDEESFSTLERREADFPPLHAGKTTLLHSGVIYPSERDPSALIEALAHLSAEGVISERNFCIRFRAPVHEDQLQALAQRHSVQNLIECLPHVGYREALGEMLRADALMVLQASNCNAQIPGKIYEYLRAGKPLIALTDPIGDTAALLHAARIDAIAPLDSSASIATLLACFFKQLRQGDAALPDPSYVARSSRLSRTAELAACLDRCII